MRGHRTVCRLPHLSTALFLPAVHPPVPPAPPAPPVPPALHMPHLCACKVSHTPAATCNRCLARMSRRQVADTVAPVCRPRVNRQQLCARGCTMAGSTFPHTACAPTVPVRAVEWGGGGCAAMETAGGRARRGGRYDGRTADCRSPRCFLDYCTGPCRLLLLPRALQRHGWRSGCCTGESLPLTHTHTEVPRSAAPAPSPAMCGAAQPEASRLRSTPGDAAAAGRPVPSSEGAEARRVPGGHPHSLGGRGGCQREGRYG